MDLFFFYSRVAHNRINTIILSWVDDCTRIPIWLFSDNDRLNWINKSQWAWWIESVWMFNSAWHTTVQVSLKSPDIAKCARICAPMPPVNVVCASLSHIIFPLASCVDYVVPEIHKTRWNLQSSFNADIQIEQSVLCAKIGLFCTRLYFISAQLMSCWQPSSISAFCVTEFLKEKLHSPIRICIPFILCFTDNVGTINLVNVPNNSLFFIYLFFLHFHGSFLNTRLGYLLPLLSLLFIHTFAVMGP